MVTGVGLGVICCKWAHGADQNYGNIYGLADRVVNNDLFLCYVMST